MILGTLLESFDLEDVIELLFRSTRVAVGRFAVACEGLGMVGRTATVAKWITSRIGPDRWRRDLHVGVAVLLLFEGLLVLNWDGSAEREREGEMYFSVDQLEALNTYRCMLWRIGECYRGWAGVFRISCERNKNLHWSVRNVMMQWLSVRYCCLSEMRKQRFDYHFVEQYVRLRNKSSLQLSEQIYWLVSTHQLQKWDRRSRRWNWASGSAMDRSEMDAHYNMVKTHLFLWKGFLF